MPQADERPGKPSAPITDCSRRAWAEGGCDAASTRRGGAQRRRRASADDRRTVVVRELHGRMMRSPSCSTRASIASETGSNNVRGSLRLRPRCWL